MYKIHIMLTMCVKRCHYIDIISSILYSLRKDISTKNKHAHH